jgi:preprotein translocase subunit SecA
VTLSNAGRAALHSAVSALAQFWHSARRREDLVRMALVAIHICRRDEHYLVRDGKVQIIDGNTGRILADRSWELGLHQMIEMKEGCPLTQPRESLARITYQRFFRRYLRLGATSGTVREVAAELWDVYHLRVFGVRSHRATRRVDVGRRVHWTLAQKHRDVVERVKRLHRMGRPVLVGTRSVASSEQLSAMLSAAGLEHEVLNARQDQREAQIVALAGEPARITIATNMAGRGTDIKLRNEVLELGGLHVIATELNESRRIDRQLFGRCGRQGDPGSFESVLSFEDNLVAESSVRTIVCACAHSSARFARLGRWIAAGLLSIVQRITERKARRVRTLLLSTDQRLARVLSFTGPME